MLNVVCVLLHLPYNILRIDNPLFTYHLKLFKKLGFVAIA